ncbi:SusC/RagA family TonB-linked outer membrane protein [Phocaeicola abscessus]|uniref:SusC/RagA family TonB-linked outer membrane protein n=1 Tax=Phocaeicola abscessus TaxID=555313 RepID=UPI00055B1F21|nr:TonB-dependent receptor [Phocaeicola abscessus]
MIKKSKVFFALLCLSIGITMAQVSKVTGVIISAEDNEPIMGASILIKGTSLGTITDIDGRYVIHNIPAGAKLLQISYVGMITQEIPISDKEQTTVLSIDSKLIDEVIVVAYGTAKKSSFTGSASVVGEKALEKRTLTNVMSAIEGNAPGVQVTSASGQPGSSPSLRIRGFGSINGSSAPLYVVDGAIYNGAMGDLNPNDIESMTILKDAASTALYGSSAGNGVVLITTKSAKGANKTTVTFDTKLGISGRAIKEYKKANPKETYLIGWEMLKNSYINGSGKDEATAAQMATDNLIDNFGGYNIYAGVKNNDLVRPDGSWNPAATTYLWADDMDWEDAVYRTGVRQEYNVSLSNKGEKSDSYASLGYLKELGSQVNTNYERFSGRANLNVYPVSWFKAGINIGATKVNSNTNSSDRDSNSSYSNLSRWIRFIPTIFPVHKHYLEETEEVLPDGKVITHQPGEYWLDALGNKQYDYEGDGKGHARTFSTGRDALAEAYWNLPEFSRNMMQGKAYADFNLFKGFTASLNATLNSNDYRSSKWENTHVGDGAPSGRLQKASTRSTIVTFNQLLKYVNNFGNHQFDLLAGHESYKYTYNYFRGMKNTVILDGGAYEFANMVNINSMNSYTDEYRKEGYLARVNYNYADRYYASFSYRHDGTSRFAKESRWGDFWSFGASWRIDQENFIKNIAWVNSLKIRASYGETGNDDIGDPDETDYYYQYKTLYNSGINNKDEAGIYFASYGNPNLKWETQISSDIAVDFSLFDRLTGTIEYFRKDSKSLLFEVPTAYSIGVSSIKANIGKVSNSGLEIDLNYQLVRSADFNLSIGGNATFLHNEIKRLPDDLREQGIVSGTKKYMEGRSVYEFWLRQYKGVNPDNGDPVYLFDETNAWNEKTCYEKNGVKYTSNVNLAKYDYSGSAVPKMQGGFNLAASYKHFDFAAIFSYKLGSDIYNTAYSGLMSSAFGDAWHPDMLKAWRKTGDVTDIPRLDSSNTTSNDASSSTRWLMSGDYLSLRSVSLAYSIPRTTLNVLKVGLQSCRISVSGENLFQLNHMQGLDAQATFNGMIYNSYYPSRTFTMGINITF